MVNRIYNSAAEIDALTEDDKLAVLNYESQLLSSRKFHSKEKPPKDDLIVALSDAYENKRARQVTEWERMRRQNVAQTA